MVFSLFKKKVQKMPEREVMRPKQATLHLKRLLLRWPHRRCWRYARSMAKTRLLHEQRTQRLVQQGFLRGV